MGSGEEGKRSACGKLRRKWPENRFYIKLIGKQIVCFSFSLSKREKSGARRKEISFLFDYNFPRNFFFSFLPLSGFSCAVFLLSLQQRKGKIRNKILSLPGSQFAVEREREREAEWAK